MSHGLFVVVDRCRQLSLPSQARTTLPTRTPKGVVLRVVRSAMSADWAPYDAADELVAYVAGDARLLEIARARVQTCTQCASTVMQARALATLNLAINRVQQRGAR